MRAAILFLSAAFLAACAAEAQEGEDSRGSDNISRSFQVGAFSSLSLAGPHNVVVQVGPAASVRAEGPAERIERLEIEVRGADLHIGTRKEDWSAGYKGDRQPVTIYVTTPTLAGASIGGSGDVRIDRVEGERFAASIGGSGDIEIASLRVSEADFSIAGSGGIKAAGSAARTKMSVAGSGDIDIASVEARNASVSIVGSGDIRATASDTADISIMGSGDVTLGGSARCTINKKGSGEVRCGA